METFCYALRVMNVTKSTIQLILNRLRNPSLPKIRQSDIAEKMGYGKAWVSKLVNGKIQTLNATQVERLEEILGIRFHTVVEGGGSIPELAAEAGRLIEMNPTFATVMAGIVELAKQEPAFTPKFIPTQDMTKVGQEIIRIAFANEDKPGKVARLVLELLR